MRPTRVYRLVVEYPDVPTIDEDDHPNGGLYPWDDGMFHWPQNRCYLSLAGAQRRARIFQRYGAEVVILRSKPVEWEEGTPVDLPKIRKSLRRLIRELA